MEKHKCKLCTRSFSNGRALGGHMKAHLAAHPLPPKLTQQQLSDGTESASSSSSGEELEIKGKSQSPEVADDEKALGYYGLRNNPKKSFRFADPEFSFAVDSGSVVVQDRESETESRNPTRRRSKRNRILSTAHQENRQKPKLKKPNYLQQQQQQLPAPAEPEPVSSVSDTSTEEDVAMCLMMLSRDVWTRNNNNEEVRDQKNVDIVVESGEKIKLIRGKHGCEKCKKAFRSHRALSGHKKVCGSTTETNNVGKVSSTDEKLFECPFCYKVFGSGQALGGHKRSHLLLANSSSTNAKSDKLENNLIDLNLPAPLEEDDFSVVSYA